MKKTLLLLALIISLTSYSQTTDSIEEVAIKTVLMQFFEAINTQDSILFDKTLLREGQIWSVNHFKEPSSYKMRFFSDNLNLFDSKKVYTETPYSMEIKWRKGLAMAWVPYEFLVDHKFSHCGIDVFTLVKAEGVWKISNATYTLERSGCEDLKKKS